MLKAITAVDHFLLGRFFIILFGDNPHTAARAVNGMSALASGLSILFLFWSITHFARKLVPEGPSRLFTIMSAGVVGALAYTFCDAFWYSADAGLRNAVKYGRTWSLATMKPWGIAS